MNIFNLDKYKHISAVIFSCSITIGRLTSSIISSGYNSNNVCFKINYNLNSRKFDVNEVSRFNKVNHGDGVFVLHNPKAINPIPCDFMVDDNVTHIFLENDKIIYKGNVNPLYCFLIHLLNVKKSVMI